MTYDTNVYYNADKIGLESIGCWDLREPDYSFDLLILVRETATGKLFAATDSGCSCPVPFEDHSFPADFTEVRSWEDVAGLVDAHGTDHEYNEMDLRATVRSALRA